MYFNVTHLLLGLCMIVTPSDLYMTYINKPIDIIPLCLHF